MTELTNYRCDICGEIYFDEASCRRCESFHVRPDALDSMSFPPMGKKKPPYPSFLIMRMEDGAMVRYAANEILNVPKMEKEVVEEEKPTAPANVFNGAIETAPVGSDCGDDE